ncbi:EAL domain-containing protein [Xylophilus sp. GOD-11R]|uniref:EAL domain-containing protein n=1 Tax=Xylophilus sp. GOD-11R TaxID=3089814 RepID=UPI00298C3D28|nr:EAL domain-containing protein [Xylophilus sp. GOD-11R]WPB59006.1 EAL domain-containing protein [Xylophilus sp. GOD-11R]
MTTTRPLRARFDFLLPVTRLLGRHPRLAGHLAGYGVAVLMLAAFCSAAVGLRVQQIQSGHARIHARMQAVQNDTSALLDELNRSYRADCTDANLKRLSALMFAHRYARAIGMLDGQGRMFCSTGMGLLPEPAPAGVNGIDGSIGRYFLSTPVQRFVGPVPGGVRATVVERGMFQVLVDSAPTIDAFGENADAVWAGGGTQRRRVFKGVHGDQTDTLVAADSPLVRIDTRHLRILVTSTVPGVSPVSAQSVLGLHALEPRHRWMIAGLLGFAALFGFLASNVVTRRCRRFQSIEHRIRYLCDPANVVCHYQPILELATGRIVGCEVLARLRDGDQLLYPDRFIPALNHQKLTWAFDVAVSRAALHELARAMEPRTGFSVALNFFPHNLRRDTLHAHLRAVQAETGRTDFKIELEVTEYDFSPDLAPELRRLKLDGYGISIDDFGTGYSNLGVVRKVSPDYLKIDRSFVFEMEDETIRSSLIPEIIAIARAVGADVIAEGIETAAQLAQLRELGVQFGQGYFFARPMPMADLQRFMDAATPLAPAPAATRKHHRRSGDHASDTTDANRDTDEADSTL